LQCSMKWRMRRRRRNACAYRWWFQRDGDCSDVADVCPYSPPEPLLRTKESEVVGETKNTRQEAFVAHATERSWQVATANPGPRATEITWAQRCCTPILVKRTFPSRLRGSVATCWGCRAAREVSWLRVSSVALDGLRLADEHRRSRGRLRRSRTARRADRDVPGGARGAETWCLTPLVRDTGSSIEVGLRQVHHRARTHVERRWRSEVHGAAAGTWICVNRSRCALVTR
jgi:hypothetical protein